ncbi:MAG: YwhD family protein, partial [Chloroflexota bacterium]|nr:YwhD family protein [Chloroflexota bacterium]
VAMVFLGVRDKEPETARYEGMIACALLIDRAAGMGWRDLTQEAMAMRRVLDGTVQLDGLTAGERIALERALQEPLGGALWQNTDAARQAAVRGTTEEASA